MVSSHVLSELDDLVSEVIYMQDGKINFQKSLVMLKLETGEEKLTKAIAKLMIADNQ